MIIPKKKLTKTYSFRVSKEELELIRTLAKEMDIPSMLRAYIKECYKQYKQDLDEQVYEATVTSRSSKRS